jgi:Uncharacterized protein conserved in bacteria
MTPQNGHGGIRISPAAIAHVARDAALQSYGVVGLTSRNMFDYLASQVRSSHLQGVRVHLKGEQIIVDLYVIVQYGTRISEVAQGVMNQVKYALERTLGVPVTQINVHVQGLRVNHESHEEEH